MEKGKQQNIEQWPSQTVPEGVQSEYDKNKHQELMLWRPQQGEGEKSIHQTSVDSDRDQMEQMVAPNDVSSMMCYQTLANNLEVK